MKKCDLVNIQKMFEIVETFIGHDGTLWCIVNVNGLSMYFRESELVKAPIEKDFK